MKSKRYWFGVIISIVWLAFCVWLIYIRWTSVKIMPLNEYGDFMAGVFAPLAFLWLVLGYLQQGEELKLSTDALHLQAKELANSVRQQESLVKVTQEQVEAAKEAVAQAELQRKIEVLPMFGFKQLGASRHDEKHYYAIALSNTGATVSGVFVEYHSPYGTVSNILNEQVFESEKTLTRSLSLDEPLTIGGKLFVEYTNRLQVTHDVSFEIEAGRHGYNEELSFSRL